MEVSTKLNLELRSFSLQRGGTIAYHYINALRTDGAQSAETSNMDMMN
ncbi:MAG TPA: hypothetical protein VJN71_07350 [Nitrososphaerales archaeon]|nr:hypothetical protein [Nitrososphaerales archaeon]